MRFLKMIVCLLFVSGAVQAFAVEDVPGERFQAMGENIVYDSQTGLMWASRGNGKDIDWYEAETYCNKFAAGGYDDWRMPEIKELATLYTKDKKGQSGFHIVDHIMITDCCVWSADENMGGAAIFSYKTGKKPAGFLADTYQLRALPVRTHKKMGLDDYNVVNKQSGND